MTPRGGGRWLDVTKPLDPARLEVWPGDPPLRSWLVSRIDPGSPEGGSANVTAASLSLHSGTHIDAPCHFIPGGKAAEEIPIEACIGPARLVRHAHLRHLTAADLEAQQARGCPRLIIAAAAAGAVPSLERYHALLPGAARWLVKEGVRLVGIDSPSIGPPGPEGEEVHRILLAAEVVVLEGLVLSGLAPGDYELAALPLAIRGSDGAPVRAAMRPLPAGEGTVGSG